MIAPAAVAQSSCIVFSLVVGQFSAKSAEEAGALEVSEIDSSLPAV